MGDTMWDKLVVTTVGLCLFSACDRGQDASSEWKLEEQKDEMTDKRSAVVVGKSIEPYSFHNPIAELVIGCLDGQYVVGIWEVFERRGAAKQLLTRLGTEPARSWTYTSDDSIHFSADKLFLADSERLGGRVDFIDMLRKRADGELLVQWPVSKGSGKGRFNLKDLDKPLAKVIEACTAPPAMLAK